MAKKVIPEYFHMKLAEGGMRDAYMKSRQCKGDKILEGPKIQDFRISHM